MIFFYDVQYYKKALESLWENLLETRTVNNNNKN